MGQHSSTGSGIGAKTQGRRRRPRRTATVNPTAAKGVTRHRESETRTQPPDRTGRLRAPRRSVVMDASHALAAPNADSAGNSVFGGLVRELATSILTAAVLLAALTVYYARDLPDTDSLWRPDRAPRYTILAADGSPLSTGGTRFGAPVRLAELPPHVVQAVLAVEDRNFHHHFGVNPLSVARAIAVNASDGSIRQGGSTITQQLAKNLFLNSDRTLKRKVQELLLALWLERKFTKDEILTLYLNRVYLGAGAYGIDAASFRYFGKPARRLALNEAALLAGLLKAPSRYNPTQHPEDAGHRAQIVVNAMVEAGFIDRQTADQALTTPIYLQPPTYAGAGYFIDHTLREARARVPDNDADLIIRTTFDPAMQFAMEQGLAHARHRGDLPDAGRGRATPNADVEIAAVVLDRFGAVRAMVGGRDYAISQFNRATQARRQPGSAFKPFVYLAALDAGVHPDHRLLDQPVTVEGWRPDNYKGRFYGDVSVTEALARSLNAATIRLQEWVGRDRVRALARAAGFPEPLNPDPALALGVDVISPLHLAQAYLPLVNNGYARPAHVVTSIETAEGDVLFSHRIHATAQVASPHAVEQLNMMMQAVTEWGTGRNARVPGWPVAGKTGTTQNNRDAWFAGHTAGLVGVVWVGRDDYKPMDDVTGGKIPARLWSTIMTEILRPLSPLSTDTINTTWPPGNG